MQKDAIDLMSAFAYPFAARIQCAFMGWPQELADVLLDWLKRSQVATLARDRSATVAQLQRWLTNSPALFARNWNSAVKRKRTKTQTLLAS